MDCSTGTIVAQLAFIFLSLVTNSFSYIEAREIAVQLSNPRLVVPFDAEAFLPNNTKRSKFVKHLGMLEIPGEPSFLSPPPFFSVSFDLHSRTSHMAKVHFRPVSHNVSLTSGVRKGQSFNQTYEFNLARLKESPFQSHKGTVIIIPGYMSGRFTEWTFDLSQAWLKLSDVNVIIVSWSDGNSGLYENAVANTPIVARQVTILLYYLAQLREVDFVSESFRSNITIVGHSLGAHIAGAIGRDFKGQLDRITGLDPAGPIFDQLSTDLRLDPSDAQFVDVIHTNSGKMSLLYGGLEIFKTWLRKFIFRNKNEQQFGSAVDVVDSFHSGEKNLWFGIDQPIGHIDYYANGGKVQPGCQGPVHVCDHARAYEIYRYALEYEAVVRASLNHGDPFIRDGYHRLVAFPSADWERFKSGKWLQRNCPELLDSAPISHKIWENAYRRCTIPMDFLSKGREFKEELKHTYGIPMDQLSADRRFFFMTLSAPPYVNEHRLLKIHLDSKSSITWTRGCQLIILEHSYSAYEIFSVTSFELTSLILHKADKFSGLILPYCSPVDWIEAYPSHDSLISDLNELQERPDSSIDNLQSLRYYATGNVTIEIRHNKVLIPKQTFFKAETDKSSSKCKLVIDALETLSISTILPNISTWHLANIYNVTYKPVMTAEELNNAMDDGRYQLNLSDRQNPFAIMSPSIIKFGPGSIPIN